MILVTGASGFVGRCVCAALHAHHRTVLALDHRGPREGMAQAPLAFVQADVCDRHQIEQVFRAHPIDAVVHLASMLSTASRTNPGLAAQVNVAGSANILEVAARFGASRFVFASSISVYGSSSRSAVGPVSETEIAAPEEVYGAGKRYVEIMGDACREQSGIQFVSLRISSVVGPGAASASSPWRSEIFEQLGTADRREVLVPYRPEEALPLVHVQEVAEMVARLVQAAAVSHPVYNTPSETWTVGYLARELESLNGNLRILLGESQVSGIPRAIDGSRFTAEFGFTPVSLKERLRDSAPRSPLEAGHVAPQG